MSGTLLEFYIIAMRCFIIKKCHLLYGSSELRNTQRATSRSSETELLQIPFFTNITFLLNVQKMFLAP